MDITLPVLSLKQRTPNIVSVFLDSKSYQIPYQAGQFFRLTLSDVNNDPRGPWRFFSNCASPTEPDFLMITTTISPSPFKQKLKMLKPGESVSVGGPFGKFILAEENKLHLFLAGGIGVTPFRSMLKYATDKKLPHRIVLLYSNKTPEDILFREDFDQITKDNPNSKIIHTMTRPGESAVSWHGKVGRINEQMVRECTTDILNTQFYVCGPPAMVESLIAIVHGLGAPEQNLKIERFTGYV